MPTGSGTGFVSAASATSTLAGPLTASQASPSTSTPEKFIVHSFLLLQEAALKTATSCKSLPEFFDSCQRRIQGLGVADCHLHSGIGKHILRSLALQTFFDKNTVPPPRPCPLPCP